MIVILAGLMFGLAIVSGYLVGVRKVSGMVRHFTALAILLLSNGVVTLSLYRAHYETWSRAPVEVSVYFAIATLIVFVVPFYLAHTIGRRGARRS